MLIAAASGRALAASARRGGYAPLVADAFGDQDTLAACVAHAHADLLARPIDGEALLEALDGLADGALPEGLVWGSGFEDRGDLLGRIGERWPLIGNDAATVAAVKDPLRLAELCRTANIAHPETTPSAPADPNGWLVKRAGGAGGLHVREAGEAPAVAGYYYQRRVEGVPISVAFLADGDDIMVLGFSEQWTAPTRRHPYRYGGAVRPVALLEPLQGAMSDAVRRIVAAVPLRGLNSADFLVHGDGFHLIEINPRPGATFDLFEPSAPSLFGLHVEACAGRLPVETPRLDGAMAGAIVYAAHDVDPVPNVAWPEWTADRPQAGTAIKADQPLCSVVARAHDVKRARELLDRRVAQVHALVAARRS